MLLHCISPFQCICWELYILCSIVFVCMLMSGLRLSDLNKETTYLLTYLTLGGLFTLFTEWTIAWTVNMSPQNFASRSNSNYTVSHEKRASLFSTITLASLEWLWQFLYRSWKREWIHFSITYLMAWWCHNCVTLHIVTISIAASIKNCSSLYSFKRHLKSHLIAQLINN